MKFFWSVFSHIWTKYREIPSIPRPSVRMRENTDQKNSEYGHFLRIELFHRTIVKLCKIPQVYLIYCALPETFHTRKLGEISVFFADQVAAFVVISLKFR